ncbi:putative membrane protein YccC [Pedobacter psychrotolerans]|nr:putative membrane protein YccC [Pedobacter psychrotolerans]
MSLSLRQKLMKREQNESFLMVYSQKLKDFAIRIRYSEYLTDALRSTFAIIIPLIAFTYFGQIIAGISISIGTLFMSLCDIPGNRRDKLIGSIIAISSLALTSFIIAISLPHPYYVATSVVIITFIFSMLSVFGNRLSLIGLIGTTLIAFTLGLHPKQPLVFSTYIIIGAAWYALISLTQIYLRPYRSLHHAIFEAIQGTAALMRLRASAYNEGFDLRDFNAQNISLHLKLNARQELIRSLLLRDRIAMSPDNPTGKKLLAAALDIIDLYEQVTAIHNDYGEIRQALAPTGALTKIQEVISQLTDLLEHSAVQFSISKKVNPGGVDNSNIEEKINQLLALSVTIPAEGKNLLIGITKNLKDISKIVERLSMSYQLELPDTVIIETEVYKDFIPETSVSWENIMTQFSLRAPVFRFALRLSLLCLIAVMPTLLFPDQRYSYWLLLTVVIVNRPSFGLTRKRNMERLWGTLIGLVIGLLLAFASVPVQLGLAAFGLLGFFLFNRTHYMWGVASVTVMVVLALNVYHGHVSQIISDRLLFTLIGCGLSYLSIFIFPIWETPRISALILNGLAASRHYLFCVATERKGFQHYYYRTKLARKDAYISFSFLSEALQSIRKEPLANNIDLVGLEDIQVLNYQLNGAIAALSLAKEVDDVMDDHEFDDCLNNLDFCIANAPSADLTSLTGPKPNTIYASKLLSSLTYRLRAYFE